MEALLKILLILLVVCVLLWLGQIWGLWFIAQGGFLAVAGAVFSAIGTWLAGLTFWQALLVVGGTMLLVDSDSVNELVSDVGEVATEAAIVIGAATGTALSAAASTLGLDSLIPFALVGLGIFFFMSREDKDDAASNLDNPRSSTALEVV